MVMNRAQTAPRVDTGGSVCLQAVCWCVCSTCVSFWQWCRGAARRQPRLDSVQVEKTTANNRDQNHTEHVDLKIQTWVVFAAKLESCTVISTHLILKFFPC